MPTQAENTINRATVEETDSKGRATGARKLLKPRPEGRAEIVDFRVTPVAGGYLMEKSIGGRFWLPQAWKITEGGEGIGADDIPAYVWDDRETWADEQAEAFAALREAKVDINAPLADYELAEETPAEVRKAARTLRGLRWLLVWPAEVVAEIVEAKAPRSAAAEG